MCLVIDRRGFLRLAGAGLAGGVVAGCTKGRPAAKPARSLAPSPPATSSPSPSPALPTGPPPWASLRLDGELLRPGGRGYDAGRLLFSPRFDAVHPAALARCATAADVQRCVAFAARYRVPLALRSGGHSYAGWSTGRGLVIDTSPLSGVRVSGDHATVGAGAQLIDVYDRLAASGRAVPAGSCATVGLAGLALGGGIGVLDRAWGLTCDNVTAVQIVTADGRLRSCDAGHDPDLFWASRGGGGGSFGVVTSFTLRVRPVPSITVAFLRWDWSHAARVLAAWQALAPVAPDAVWSNCQLAARPGSGTPKVSVGVAALDAGLQRAFVAALLARVGAVPASNFAETLSYRRAMLLEAGCADRTVAQCHVAGRTPQGQLARPPYAAKSDFVGRPLSSAGIAAMVAGIEVRQAMRGVQEGSVALDAFGGAISRVGVSDTAFPHRAALCSVQYIASWAAGSSVSTVDTNLTWLRDFHARMRPYVTGGAYLNYADAELPAYQQAYWGANYQRLQRIKAAYDPGRLFTFAQAVRPA